MNHIADRFVVLIDENIFASERKLDVMLRFYVAGLFRARWSSEILIRWKNERSRKKKNNRVKVEMLHECIVDNFPEALVSGYSRLASQ